MGKIGVLMESEQYKMDIGVEIFSLQHRNVRIPVPGNILE
jgi:hypothetical protein